jgi:hypothetical protein
MKYFAKIGLNNKVMQVVCVNDQVLLDANNLSDENLGIEFLEQLTGWSIWKQSFPDKTKRKNHAGIGYTYDEDRDAFIPKKPFASWILNETTCQWEAPIVKPDNGQKYIWNETIKNWELVE